MLAVNSVHAFLPYPNELVLGLMAIVLCATNGAMYRVFYLADNLRTGLAAQNPAYFLAFSPRRKPTRKLSSDYSCVSFGSPISCRDSSHFLVGNNPGLRRPGDSPPPRLVFAMRHERLRRSTEQLQVAGAAISLGRSPLHRTTPTPLQLLQQ
jgi:hypothetical protein